MWASMSRENYGMWTVISCLWLSQAKAINRGHVWLQLRVLCVLHYWSPVATTLKGLDLPKCCWHPQDFDLMRDVVHMSGWKKSIFHFLCLFCEERFSRRTCLSSILHMALFSVERISLSMWEKCELSCLRIAVDSVIVMGFKGLGKYFAVCQITVMWCLGMGLIWFRVKTVHVIIAGNWINILFWILCYIIYASH